MTRRQFPLLFALAALSGCVMPPSLGPAPQPKVPSSYSAAESLSGPVTAWPQARWWEGYGDPQLNSLIAEALRNAPSMAQASARLQRAQALASQSEASFYPAISTDVSITEAKPSTENGIPVTPARQGWNDYGKASISFSWEIDFWGKNRAAVAAATSDAKATEADAAAARLVLSTAVAASYADLARLFADRDVLAATLTIREQSSR